VLTNVSALCRYTVLNAPVPPGAAAVSPEDVAPLQRRLLDLADAGLTAEEYFSGWFRGAPYEAIRRGNVEDFIAYGFHARPWADITPQVPPCSCASTAGQPAVTSRCHDTCRPLIL
jgi:hypothetical protein